MKKLIAAMLVLLLLLSGMQGLAEKRRVEEANTGRFIDLLTALVNACESPSVDASEDIDAALEAIRQNSEADYEIASAITDHWRTVYLDGDYILNIHQEGDPFATSLAQSDLRDSDRHAFVVLGYELKDGEMTDELKGRCDAAAAAARSYPSAILVCSGGATGENNPMQHTEAGMMKAYLVEQCGIEASRIHIDEAAKTTLENAVNTMKILKQQGIQTMTIVTSTYHQRWGQAIYNAVAALYRQANGYSVEIVENYCYDIEPSKDIYRNDARIAARQLAQLLGLPVDR